LIFLYANLSFRLESAIGREKLSFSLANGASILATSLRFSACVLARYAILSENRCVLVVPLKRTGCAQAIFFLLTVSSVECAGVFESDAVLVFLSPGYEAE